MNIFKRLFKKKKTEEERIEELNEQLAKDWQREQEEIFNIEVVDEEIIPTCLHPRRSAGYCLECGGKV